MNNSSVKDIRDIDRYMALKPVNDADMEFFSPFSEPFRLSGSAFQKQLQSRLRRIPIEPVINEKVDWLADYTAGMQLQFKSSSRKVVVKAKLKFSNLMHHMPQTGHSSFDFYVGGPGKWRAVRSAQFKDHATEFTAELYNRPEHTGMREYLINFPLYNGVEELWIGLDENCQILPPTDFSGKPLLVYGTSITQGGCASRPGMAWSNILSRKLNREVFNFGFSGNGKGEAQMAEFLAQIPDPGAIILDYEPNAHYDGIRATLSDFIRILRNIHPTVPLTVMSGTTHSDMTVFGTDDDVDSNYPDSAAARKFQQQTVESLQQAGDCNIYFIDGSKLMGSDWDECLIDGCHLNDLGFYRIAENLSKQLVFN